MLLEDINAVNIKQHYLEFIQPILLIIIIKITLLKSSDRHFFFFWLRNRLKI